MIESVDPIRPLFMPYVNSVLDGLASKFRALDHLIESAVHSAGPERRCREVCTSSRPTFASHLPRLRASTPRSSAVAPAADDVRYGTSARRLTADADRLGVGVRAAAGLTAPVS